MSNNQLTKHEEAAISKAASKELLLQELLLVLHKDGIDVEGILRKISPENLGAAMDAYDLFKGQLEWFDRTGQTF